MRIDKGSSSTAPCPRCNSLRKKVFPFQELRSIYQNKRSGRSITDICSYFLPVLYLFFISAVVGQPPAGIGIMSFSCLPWPFNPLTLIVISLYGFLSLPVAWQIVIFPLLISRGSVGQPSSGTGKISSSCRAWPFNPLASIGDLIIWIIIAAGGVADIDLAFINFHGYCWTAACRHRINVAGMFAVPKQLLGGVYCC